MDIIRRSLLISKNGPIGPRAEGLSPLKGRTVPPYPKFMKSEHNLTVLIVDEHSGISLLLAERLGLIPGIRVVGETANVMLGAELAHQFEPDVILADFRRTGPPRAETYRWLSRVSPSSRVVAHTSYLPNGDERVLREAGVARCVLKGDSVKKLAEHVFDIARSPNGRPSTNGSNGKEA
jgi:AmiR/NasT family two-component response regulator